MESESKKYYLSYYDVQSFSTGFIDAYNYIDTVFLRDSELLQNEYVAGAIDMVWRSYASLMQEIAFYNFHAKKESSRGGIQNSTNEQILDQLSLFNPLIFDICTSINDMFYEKGYVNPAPVENLENKIQEKLNQLAYTTLSQANNNLARSRVLYEESMYDYTDQDFNGKKAALSELRKYANDWRKKRNAACQSILDFVAEMVKLDIVVYYNTFDYKNEQYGLDKHTNQKIDYYNQCISYLQHSSNYFCYLNDCEKQEIIMDKVLRKKQEN